MRVADITTEDFKTLIGKVFEEKIRELIDPDYGLELREDFKERLTNSIASKERVPFENVKKKLGLS